MAYGLVTHVALIVPDVVDAETFYTTLFDTEVAYRQTPVDGEWRTLPADVDWRAAETAGYPPRMSFISKDHLFLALAAPTDGTDAAAQTYHVGLEMDEMEFAALHRRATELGCEWTQHADDPAQAILRDRYGYEWDVTTEWSTERSGTPSGPWLAV